MTFSMPQFTALILVAMGVSRVIQVGSFISVSLTDVSKSCVHHLGEDACRDTGVITVLRLKYFMGIQLAMLVFLTMLQCWQSDELLTRLNACMLLTPIVTGLLTLFMYSDILPAGPIWKESMTGLVMGVLAMPQSFQSIPFLSGQQKKAKTLQSLTLILLVLVSLWEAYRLLWLSVSTSVQSLVNTDSPLAIVPVTLLGVDYLTFAIIFAFGWFYFEGSSQRVRITSVVNRILLRASDPYEIVDKQSLLLSISGVKLLSYFVHLPLLIGLKQIETMKTIEITIAIGSALVWFAPTITWKKEL